MVTNQNERTTMAIKFHDDRTISPTVAAKHMVAYSAASILDDWGGYLQCDKLTEKETERVGEALNKQLARVFKLLGI
jgi:hypothetical protein